MTAEVEDVIKGTNLYRDYFTQYTIKVQHGDYIWSIRCSGRDLLNLHDVLVKEAKQTGKAMVSPSCSYSAARTGKGTILILICEESTDGDPYSPSTFAKFAHSRPSSRAGCTCTTKK